MKKVIFIFLILISCLCLAVVSCADKEESSTSSSSTDNTTTVSIVDGSAEGYMKIGNMLMVWGATVAGSDVDGDTVTFDFSGGIGGLSKGLHEWIGLTFYWLTGRTNVFFPGPESTPHGRDSKL